MPYNKDIENRMNPIITKWGMRGSNGLFSAADMKR